MVLQLLTHAVNEKLGAPGSEARVDNIQALGFSEREQLHVELNSEHNSLLLSCTFQLTDSTPYPSISMMNFICEILYRQFVFTRM